MDFEKEKKNRKIEKLKNIEIKKKKEKKETVEKLKNTEIGNRKKEKKEKQWESVRKQGRVTGVEILRFGK